MLCIACQRIQLLRIITRTQLIFEALSEASRRSSQSCLGINPSRTWVKTWIRWSSLRPRASRTTNCPNQQSPDAMASKDSKFEKEEMVEVGLVVIVMFSLECMAYESINLLNKWLNFSWMVLPTLLQTALWWQCKLIKYLEYLSQISNHHSFFIIDLFGWVES